MEKSLEEVLRQRGVPEDVIDRMKMEKVSLLLLLLLSLLLLLFLSLLLLLLLHCCYLSNKDSAQKSSHNKSGRISKSEGQVLIQFCGAGSTKAWFPNFLSYHVR